MKKWIAIIASLLIVSLAGVYWTDKNNPSSQNTWVKPFFNTKIDNNGEIILRKIRDIQVVQNPLGAMLFDIQAFFRIEGNVFNPEKPFQGNEQQIINQIHQERFNPQKAYLITGGHFADLYTRNLGVFYSAILDPRIPTSKQDWEMRQEVALQRLATDLELLKQAKKDYTTFTPINNNTFIAINFNTRPSDTLFSSVYTLRAATDESFIMSGLPANAKTYSLQTKLAAKQLLSTYKPILTVAISNYLQEIIDPNTGLVKKNIILSSARDSIKRQSSFYDNLIAWATAKYATELKIPITCPAKFKRNSAETCNFQNWKKLIISAFWDEKDGVFIDDLSAESQKNHTFTGEAFIATQIKFLDPQNPQDQQKLLRLIQYVKQNKLDQPLPLFYATKDYPTQLYFFVRFFATSYMGQSIWSHLGQEYIDTLILLSPHNPVLLKDAQKYVEIYKENIEKYGGYPELYDKNGNIFMTPFYKSVLHTGWVINYEQTKMLLNASLKPQV